MQQSGTSAQFFSSANTPQGYLTCFHDLYHVENGSKAYILSGGYGLGGAFILKKVAETLTEAGEAVEYLYSCLNSDMLEAIVLPNLSACVLNGAPPNDISPKYPGLSESVINLGESINEAGLSAQLANILLFSSRISTSSERAFRFLAAAASLLSDTSRLALECTDMQKLESYAAHLSRREFLPQKGQGNESLRFLTAVTPAGLKSLSSTVTASYSRIIEIVDEFGTGRLFLNKLRSEALSSGYDVITCCCPIFPDSKPEHLLIPSLNLAFLTSSHFHRFENDHGRHIHMRRFIDGEALKLKRPRISFNRKATRELLDESVLLLSDAQASRDMINSIYSSATDTAALDSISDRLAARLVARRHL